MDTGTEINYRIPSKTVGSQDGKHNRHWQTQRSNFRKQTNWGSKWHRRDEMKRGSTLVPPIGGSWQKASLVFLPHNEELAGHEKIDVHISGKGDYTAELREIWKWVGHLDGVQHEETLICCLASSFNFWWHWLIWENEIKSNIVYTFLCYNIHLPVKFRTQQSVQNYGPVLKCEKKRESPLIISSNIGSRMAPQ